MRIVLAAVAAIVLSPAAALAQQDHDAHQPQAAAGDKMDMSKMTPEEMHKHCAMMMGGKMRGAPKHDHAAEKSGQAPAYKPPSEAEMKAMHDKCAANMAKPGRHN